MRSIIDKALQAILKMLKKKDERVLLWENASPEVAMVAQTISLSKEDYPYIMIEYRRYSKTQTYATVVVPNGRNNTLYNISDGMGADKLLICGRQYDFTGTNLALGAGGYKHVDAPTRFVADNLRQVPQKIYGLKSGGKLANGIRKCLRGGVCYG